MIWNAASPFIAIDVARFQSRPEKSDPRNHAFCAFDQIQPPSLSDFSVAISNSTNAFWKNSGPPMPKATASNTVASCQAWPPCAKGEFQPLQAFHRRRIEFIPCCRHRDAIFASTSAFAQIQSILCTFTVRHTMSLHISCDQQYLLAGPLPAICFCNR